MPRSKLGHNGHKTIIPNRENDVQSSCSCRVFCFLDKLMHCIVVYYIIIYLYLYIHLQICNPGLYAYICIHIYIYICVCVYVWCRRQAGSNILWWRLVLITGYHWSLYIYIFRSISSNVTKLYQSKAMVLCVVWCNL